MNRIGPLNLSSYYFNAQIETAKLAEKISPFHFIPDAAVPLTRNFQEGHKKIGIDAWFNVPNDADDTSLGIATAFYYYRQGQDQKEFAPFLKMTEQYSRYVDSYGARAPRHYKDFAPECHARWAAQTDPAPLFKDPHFLTRCSLDDPRERWRYESFSDTYSNSFLTWFYDEKEDVYAHPEAGIAMPGQNSTDCSTLTNVLYALSLTEARNSPGLHETYVNSCRALSTMILDETNQTRRGYSFRKVDGDRKMATWSYCGLFYPAHMTFPYLISKAISEARTCQDLPEVDQTKFDLAMKTLAQDLAQEQDQSTENKSPGQWYEKIDSATALPTALGGLALLNFHNSYGDRLGISADDVKARIEAAIQFVMGETHRTVDLYGTSLATVPAGTFFGGGTANEIAHWRSSAFSTAVSLELMTKYLLTYSLEPGHGPRLEIQGDEALVKDASFTVTNSARSVEKPQALPPSSPAETLDPLHMHRLERTLHVGGTVARDGTEAVIGIELSAGEHWQTDLPADKEKVAYYRVKLNAQVGGSASASEYNITARFLGISAKSNFGVNDDVGFFPVQYLRDSEIKSQSLYLIDSVLTSPLLRTSGGLEIGADLTAQLIGAAHRASLNRASSSSYNLADFTIRFTATQQKLSASALLNTEVGVTQTGGSARSSTRNYILQGGFTYQMSSSQKISLIFRRSNKAPLDLFNRSSGVSAVYDYSWSR